MRHPWRSVGGGVVDHDQADDPSVADGEVAGQDQRVGQAGLVVLAVVPAADDRLSIVLDQFDRLDRDAVADDLLGDPAADRVGPQNSR